jgi:hypothetical protein
MNEKTLTQELRNIVLHEPLWPGDTLSHATANELVRRGLASRGGAGNAYFVATVAGIRAAGIVNACGCKLCQAKMRPSEME